MKALQKENIQVVLRQNDNGIIYGITYVDHKTKCVFNGSHLGKQYSANAIQQRCNAEQLMKDPHMKLNNHQFKSQNSLDNKSSHLNQPQPEDINITLTEFHKVLDDLINPEKNQNANEPFEQKKFKRKRKRKQQQSHN